MKVKVEFAGGLEMMFAGQKTIDLVLESSEGSGDAENKAQDLRALI